MVGSGLLTYQIPYRSARTKIGQAAAPSAIGSYSIYTTLIHPNTQNLIKGWQWDNTIWTDPSIQNTIGFLPTNWDPTESGITQTYFQSGIGDNYDLEVEKFEFIPNSGLNENNFFRIWSPVVNHGYYYQYEEEGYLFSDDSEVNYPTFSGIEIDSGELPPVGHNLIALGYRPKVGIPIIAQQYEWDEADGTYNLFLNYRKKIHFTGTKDADYERIDTYSDGVDIIWDNIDNSEDEFILTFYENNAELIFNKQVVTEVGASSTLPSGLEFIGYTTGAANEQFHTIYSPIDSSMDVNVYSYITDSGSITEWTPITTDVTPNGYQVQIDYDLGILEFGDTAEAGQLVPEAGSSIGIHYWKTLHVEAEPEHTRDSILGFEANINPIYRKSSNGFVYLSLFMEDPASITLRADAIEIQADIFGPVNIGNSYVPVIATVKDTKGNVLEDQVVTFFITSIPQIGGLAGDNVETSSVTDEIGEATAYYSTPKNISEIGEDILASNYSTTNNPAAYPSLTQITTLHTSKILIEGSIEDLFLYETHIDDPILGYLDTTEDISDANAQLASYYSNYFLTEGMYGPTGVDATTLELTPTAVAWENAHREVWNLVTPVLFNANLGLGRKKLVSAVNALMLNPYTFEPGAVGPVQPYNIQSNGLGEFDIIFDTSTLAIPEPTASLLDSPTGTLYSYFVVAPTTVKLQASVYNERLNKTIYSNEMFVKLQIPSYMNGLWLLNAINENHINEISSLLADVTANGQLVPLGFRLRSSGVTLAAALDGITFLDVNRLYNYDPWDPDNIPGVGVHVGCQFTIDSIV